jgi:phosphinothricin acetyltransferase
MNAYRLEPLVDDHAPAVVEIFNHFVRSSFSAYPSAPVDGAFYVRLAGLAQGYPAVAAVGPDGAVAGFGMLRRWHPADSFGRTAEVTYFIRPEHTGRGLGAQMLAHFEAAARRMGIDTILASISSLNEGSIRFHRRNGFVECGRFRAVGRKFDRDFDVVWMQKRL